MNNSTPLGAAAVGDAVATAHREEWAAVLAAVVRLTRDFDLAEECVQDAYVKALSVWADRGVPAQPAAWLTTTAKNRALDLLRHQTVRKRALPLLIVQSELSQSDAADAQLIDDDRLRMIFTCCHPALSPEAQAALTLRFACGLTTAEIAQSFLVSESTMAARITRAKKKIATARIPYRVPSAEELPGRTAIVLEVLNLLFTTGHTSPRGSELVRGDLTAEAVRVGRMLHALLARDREVTGILAMMLLTTARVSQRAWPNGELKLLAEQDRSGWNHELIREGQALVEASLHESVRLGIRPGKYALLAAISALHDEAPSMRLTDWPQIVGIYDVLLREWPSPVVQLNRAVALSFATGPGAALEALDALRENIQLAGYPYFHAARAHCLARLERHGEAARACDVALELSENAVERQFLQKQRAASESMVSA